MGDAQAFRCLSHTYFTDKFRRYEPNLNYGQEALDQSLRVWGIEDIKTFLQGQTISFNAEVKGRITMMLFENASPIKTLSIAGTSAVPSDYFNNLR